MAQSDELLEALRSGELVLAWSRINLALVRMRFSMRRALWTFYLVTLKLEDAKEIEHLRRTGRLPEHRRP